MNIEDYTQQPLEEAGTYRAWPIAWTLEPSPKEDSKSVAIAIRFVIHQKWHGKEQGWSQEWAPGWFTEGRLYVIKRDGSLSAGIVANLQKCGLWDGDFDRLTQPPPNRFVHVDVAGEQYEGKTRFRVNWVNPDTDEPVARGGFAPLEQSLVDSLKKRFGAQTKAVAGGNTTGTPTAPPPAPAPAPVAAPVAQDAVQPQQPAPAPQAAPTPPQQPRAPQVAPPQRAAQRTPPGPPQPQPVVPPPSGDADDPIDVDDTPF